ncbi:MAG: GYD domain-containing protein [Carbonactinosporaceae bacterium]
MNVVLLARAAEAPTRLRADQFEELRAQLESLGVRVESAWVLLGQYDFLFVLDVSGPPETAFAAMSKFAQLGTMRTQSLVALPLDYFFDASGELGVGASPWSG